MKIMEENKTEISEKTKNTPNRILKERKKRINDEKKTKTD